jgi:hypothetical protein
LMQTAAAEFSGCSQSRLDQWAQMELQPSKHRLTRLFSFSASSSVRGRQAEHKGWVSYLIMCSGKISLSWRYLGEI